MEFINNQTPYKLHQEIEMVELKKTYHDFVFVDPVMSDMKKYLITLQEYKNKMLQHVNEEINAVDINCILKKK